MQRYKKNPKIANTSEKSPYQNLPFEIPQGWVWCRFPNLYILVSGRDLETQEFNDKNIGIPYIIGASNFNNGKININRWTNFPKVISIKNDLLLTCKGTIGELTINDMNEVHIARQIMAIRTITTIDTRYTKYCFSFFIENIKESAKGIIPGISREDILDLIIPLPPLAEQKRIVSAIESAFALIDEIENSKLSLSQFIKQTKSKVLDLAIRGKLVPQNPNDEPASVLLEKIKNEQKTKKIVTDNLDYPFEVPEGWVACKLSDICVFERGITFPSSAKQTTKIQNTIACVRTANVQENLELDDLWYVDKSYIKNNANKLLRQSDIIMSSANSRELVGKTSFVEDIQQEMTFGGFVMVIRTEKVDSKFLFYFLRDRFFKGLFASNSTQTTNIANINSTKLGEMSLQIPPLGEQKRIVQKIEAIFEILDSIQNNL